ncbi:MAG TPA: hypothetical protein VMI92_03100 [Steroidobacteraceae bacterium]|nr:hypothetical protein [Steroidobacteraceae bacterium]
MKGELPALQDVSEAVARAIPRVRAPLTWLLGSWMFLNLMRLPGAATLLRRWLARRSEAK